MVYISLGLGIRSCLLQNSFYEFIVVTKRFFIPSEESVSELEIHEKNFFHQLTIYPNKEVKKDLSI